MTYVIQGENGSVGDVGGAVEVATVLATVQGNVAVGNLSTVEMVQALQLDSLLKVDAILSRQAPWLDLCPSVDGDAHSLVVVEPDIESGELLHVGDFDMLTDVDDLVLVGIGLRELHSGERDMGRPVLEIHIALEGIDLGMDLAIGGDGRVDLHLVIFGFGLEDVDALDLKLGLVHLVLCDFRDGDEDATEYGSAIPVVSTGRYDLHQGNNENNNTAQHDEVDPPEALAVSRTCSLLGPSDGSILRLGELLLIRHVELGCLAWVVVCNLLWTSRTANSCLYIKKDLRQVEARTAWWKRMKRNQSFNIQQGWNKT